MSVSEWVSARLHGTADRYQTKTHIITIPNIVTSLGIICCFAFLYVLHQENNVWLLPLLALLIVISDLLDGMLADYFNQHSYVGKILDPIRDRVFTVFIAYAVYTLHPSSYILTALLVAGLAEIAIWICATLRFKRGVRMYVHAWGKTRAAVQWICLMIPLTLFAWFDSSLSGVISICVAIVTLSSVLVAIYYIFLYHKGRVA